MLRSFLLLLILHVVQFKCANGATANFTIDDQDGDELTSVVPTYNPVEYWEQGADCTGCALQPNKSYAFKQTWHDSTYDAVRRPGVISMNLLFNGACGFERFDMHLFISH